MKLTSFEIKPNNKPKPYTEAIMGMMLALQKCRLTFTEFGESLAKLNIGKKNETR